jgi:hypothetical protein
LNPYGLRNLPQKDYTVGIANKQPVEETSNSASLNFYLILRVFYVKALPSNMVVRETVQFAMTDVLARTLN